MPNVPTMIRGQLYPSQTAAAYALGVSLSRINHAVADGTTDTVGLGRSGRPGKPCYLNGKRWPSRAAAARALGVPASSVAQALRRHNLYVRPGGKGMLV